MSRRKVVHISPEAFMHIFEDGNVLQCKVSEGIPLGAKLVGCHHTFHYQHDAGVFVMELEHSSFEDIPLGVKVPILDLRLDNLEYKQQINSCNHKWVKYQGIYDNYIFCEQCEERKK